MSTNLLLSPWHCPECDVVNYGIPRCLECGWVDSEWEKWEKEMKEFWNKHKDKITFVTKGRTEDG